ncbi:MAG: DUF494 domain-containing protein [Proteobacteria bacterium]|nr:DUF494 domain-containing protein [Pseudomonadota bacterium]
MKENAIDVLMFLFDNYLSLEEGMPADEMTLACELEEAGFETNNINKAFDWLGELADIKQADLATLPASSTAIRVYLQEEQQKLDTQCQGFLLQLENMGLINSTTREMIIDRAMAIDSALSLTQFKRIVGLVVLNSGTQAQLHALMEDLIYDETEATLH